MRIPLAGLAFSAMVFTLPRAASAQGDLIGRVMAEGPARALAGAEVRLPRAGRVATSDSLGGFQFLDLPAGPQLVEIRLAGFRTDSVTVDIPPLQSLVRDFVLSRPSQALAEVRVSGQARPTALGLAGFDARRQQGIGSFLDRDQLAKLENRSMTMIFASVPGLSVMHGTGTRGWAYSTRSVTTGRSVFSGATGPCDGLDTADCEAGARPHCYMDVYVNGALVYAHDRPSPMPLFDLSSIPAAQIEGVEVYSSAAQVPSEYNRTGAACGVVLIWTRQ